MLYDKEVLFFMAIGMLVFLLLVFAVIGFIIYYNKKQVAFYKERQVMQTRFSEELLRTQLEIQEQTLQNISQEIHDNIGQTLSLVKLNLNTVDHTDTEKAKQKLTNTKELVSKAILDLRTLSKTLHPEAMLAAGLIKAVKMELTLIEKVGVFNTSLVIEGDPYSIDSKKELLLFRMIQEGLNNSIKHSHATAIRILIDFQATGLRLVLSDNGCGFDKARETSGGDRGSGLRNMQNRIGLIGGNLQIDSSRKGTQIEITVPIF